MADKKTITIAIMDAPYENARSTTTLRLIDLAAKRGYNINVFAYEGAVLQPFAAQIPHTNAVHGRNVEEENPALGWRAIRIGLDRPAMLRAQLRAFIRAAAGRELRVTFPLIAEVAELDAARLVIASVSSQIRLPQTEPAKTGGHLVLVTGHDGYLVTFHDPAGHTPEAGVATLPMPVFDRFAAHRGVSLHL